ncbi:MAG: glycosyltransferase family 1 protein [Holophaga sp.]|nr:glycosyltransferase family 1 protein [Holophaga sp.]
MKIALVTDAWQPQVNGVVRSLERTRTELVRLGHQVEVVHPGLFRTLPCPTYPEILLAWSAPWALPALLRELAADAVHVATEGPLGWAARAWCRRRGMGFTTSFHTRFPEYVRARTGLPVGPGYALFRHFHNGGRCTMVATQGLREELAQRGFRHLALWSRGVDTDLFRPQAKTALDFPRPIHLYFGRVAVEKNLDAFLDLDLPGSKVVIGAGPALERLRARYPDAHFLGEKVGEDLARHVAAADVFVFPSRTDTFGLVILEAMACGIPVAAFPVAGPRDVLVQGETGILDEDLGRAARAALALSPQACRVAAMARTWRSCAEQFLANLAV